MSGTTVLTKRRAVDNCRTRSCLCRMTWGEGAPLRSAPVCAGSSCGTSRKRS